MQAAVVAATVFVGCRILEIVFRGLCVGSDDEDLVVRSWWINSFFFFPLLIYYFVKNYKQSLEGFLPFFLFPIYYYYYHWVGFERFGEIDFRGCL